MIMGDVTKIQWCHHTFNPWRGCSKVHTGCANCYAETEAKRFPENRGIWGPHGTRVRAADSMWLKPITWNKAAEGAGERRRVFCASLADVFEDFSGDVLNHVNQKIFCGPNGERMATALDIEHGGAINLKADWRPLTLDDLRADLFKLIAATPWLDWMLLTKRPENIPRMWGDGWRVQCRQNVWIGTSVSDQQTADAMIPKLIECRSLSPVLFVSAEPLIGPIKFQISNLNSQIDMIIVGGESGHSARNCELSWVRSIVEQCQRAEVACFVKQLGAVSVWRYCEATGAVIRPQLEPELVVASLNDQKGGDPSEWPKDLRVRQIPKF